MSKEESSIPSSTVKSEDTVESFLEDSGGCGIFQVLVVLFGHVSCVVAAWNSHFMTYGIYNPGWTCLDQDYTNQSTLQPGSHGSSNSTSSERLSCDTYRRCTNVVFSSDSSTIVTEWHLACDETWRVSLMISVEMGGVLFGALSGGHIVNYMGRKSCHYMALLAHAILNLIAVFAVSPAMYTALCFFLGIAIGLLFSTYYVYPMEFVVSKWRGVVTAIPASNTGYLTFAIVAMLLRDWRMLHLVTFFLALLWILPVFWMPESLRWLAIKGKSRKAYEVALKVSRSNKSKRPDVEVISKIVQRENERKVKKRAHTIVDLYRRTYVYRTVTASYTWVSLSLAYHVIMFGVKNLSGNFFVNLMIFSFITTSALVFVPFISNTLGRKWGLVFLLLFSILSGACLIGIHVAPDFHKKGLVIMIVSLLLLTTLDSAWALLILFSLEFYPTPLRSLGYGNGTCIAQIGAIIAPFLIPEDQYSAHIANPIITLLLIVATVMMLFLPDTKGKQMADSLSETENKSEMEHMTSGDNDHA